MVQGKTSPNKGLFAGLIGIGVLAIVIGCGGGGGSLGGSTTATASGTTGTATATVTATATATASATSTASSTASATSTATSTATGGNISGSLPPNVLIYNFTDPTDATNQTVDVDYISSDATTTPQTQFATFNNTSYALAAPNPNPATGKTNMFAFAYTDPTTTLVDIFANATVSITNAKRITTKGFTSIGSLQWSPDGTHLVFTATVGSGNSQVYVCNSDGTQLRFIDNADDAYLADDGVSIAYTKEDSTPNGQIWTVHIDGTNVRQITTDDFDHFNPQWSKDATRLCWSASPSTNGFDIYDSLPDGTQLNQATNLQGDAAVSPSFNNDGTQIGFVDIPATNVSIAGVYYTTINGLGLTQVVAQPTILQGLYWTSGVGTAIAGHKISTPVFGKSYHIARLKKLGRWHFK